MRDSRDPAPLTISAVCQIEQLSSQEGEAAMETPPNTYRPQKGQCRVEHVPLHLTPCASLFFFFFLVPLPSTPPFFALTCSI